MLVKTETFQKPSVLMVASGNPKNGLMATTTFVKSQADSLRAAKCEVFLTIVDDRTSVRGILRNVQRIKAEVARFKPGLIHAQYGSVTAAVANLIKGSLPLVVSFCGDDLLGTPQPGVGWRVREAGARFMGLWAAEHAAAIIIKSNNLRQALPASMRLKTNVLPNGVDTSLFKPMVRDECRDKLGWNRHSKIVLFNGSEDDNQNSKNPALARATVDLLARAVPDVSLHVLSNTNHTEVPLIMNAADCLLVTSLHEGSPNIVKEAMACNLPVVSVPCGDVAERLRMTHPGSVCRPYGASVLADGIQDVLNSATRSNGREQLIAQGLTTAKVAERLIQIYREIQEKNFSIASRAA
jgi:glycosyltransferase involved in cell wall biosynthesis